LIAEAMMPVVIRIARRLLEEHLASWQILPSPARPAPEARQ
jgi:hypothetical protein